MQLFELNENFKLSELINNLKSDWALICRTLLSRLMGINGEVIFKKSGSRKIGEVCVLDL